MIFEGQRITVTTNPWGSVVDVWFTSLSLSELEDALNALGFDIKEVPPELVEALIEGLT